MNKIFIFLLILITNFCAVAQLNEKSKKTFSICYDVYHTARLIKFNNAYESSLLLPENLTMTEISIKMPADGSKKWHLTYNYPSLGLTLNYTDFVKPDLGFALALNPFIEFYFYRGTRIHFTFSPSFGLAYNSKYWKSHNNPNHTGTSTALTSSISFVSALKYKILPNISLNSSFNFKHFSNGSIALPNNGMNFFGFGLGAEYTFNNKPISRPVDTSRAQVKKTYFHFGMAMGHKSIDYGQYAKFFILSPEFYISQYVSQVSNVLAGVEVLYDESFWEEYRSKRMLIKNPDDVVNWAVAATLGHELKIGKFSYITQVAYYIYKQEIFYQPWYHRHTAKLIIAKNVYAKVSLKVYVGAADLFDYGLGVRL